MAREVNFDGLVGPTHNYAGMAYGNVASMKHGGQVSNPREAALMGLEKMRLVRDLGVSQAVIPPRERPHLPTLRRAGFRGKPADMLSRAAGEAPDLLAAVCSASGMWAANAATVSPSMDTRDGKLHITPANLTANLHRCIEAEETAVLFKKIFRDTSRMTIHPPLPGGSWFGDEGAANHLRLSPAHGEPGLEVFVYGRSVVHSGAPRIFPARQTREASESVARLHDIPHDRIFFLRQNPDIIDKGIFHNDVISLSNERILLYHALAFENGQRDLVEIQRRFEALCGAKLTALEVGPGELRPDEAVATYLFNSQLLTLQDRGMALIAPRECEHHAAARAVIDRILTDPANPIHTVHYVDLRQSMENGGGPACLRLRVVLTEEELAEVHPGVMLTEELHERLNTWIVRFYRDRLGPADLQDPELLQESYAALDELSQIMNLGSIYEFQKTP